MKPTLISTSSSLYTGSKILLTKPGAKFGNLHSCLPPAFPSARSKSPLGFKIKAGLFGLSVSLPY